MKKNYYLPVGVCALAVCLALCFAVVAWVGPSGNPPDSNIAAPINTGAEAQYKTGGFGVKIGGALTYWISQIGNNLVFKTGDDFATATETVNINTDGRIGNVSAPIDDKDAVNKAYLDAQSGGSGGTGYGTCVGTLLDIKFTQATYTGNLGGIAGADAKCAEEYPGYHFCHMAEVKNFGKKGCLPISSQYGGTRGGFIEADEGSRNCVNWTSASPPAPDNNFPWILTSSWQAGYSSGTCDLASPIACCKEI